MRKVMAVVFALVIMTCSSFSMAEGIDISTLSDDELIDCLSSGGEAAVESVMRCIERKDRKDQDNSTLILVDVRG